MIIKNRAKKKILEQQTPSKSLQISTIYTGMNFFLGKDLSEDVKEELTTFIKECEGYYR
jgi:hypothetical protein